jgi:photosystem II stability/assembly factor-like uncharacterized protein
MKRPGTAMLALEGPALRRAFLAALSAGAAFLLFSFLIPAAGGQTEPGKVEWSELARLAPKSLLLDVAEADGRIFAVGERGHILVSEDKGATWTQARVPTRSMFNAVAAVNGQQAWAVGHDSVIVHTADGGKTWELQHFAPEEASPLFDVWFENASHGLAIGAYAYFLETRDGGKTWEQRDVDEEERHWNGIAAAPDGALYVAAEVGAVFRSEDKGETWEVLSTPYKGSFFGAMVLKDGTVLVFGLRGRVYRSVDRGQTWQQIQTGTTSGLLAGLQLSDGTVVIVGLSGTILLSEDGGNTFRSANRPDRLGISSLIELGSKGVILVGEGGIHRVDRLG